MAPPPSEPVSQAPEDTTSEPMRPMGGENEPEDEPRA
jgi:hypothetical protein